jgi:purine nucleosidase
LGPLTNIALAIRLDADFLKRIKRLVMMAGAVDGRGNTSPPAEFNIAADPEAAKVVFEACGRARLQPELISWETTLAHPISVADWDDMIAGQSATARLVQGMTKHIKQRMNSKTPFFLWPDPLAAAVAIAPGIILSQESRYLEVESGQNLARGQTIVDYRLRHYQEPNAQIVRKINIQIFQELLQMAIRPKKEGKPIHNS